MKKMHLLGNQINKEIVILQAHFINSFVEKKMQSNIKLNAF